MIIVRLATYYSGFMIRSCCILSVEVEASGFRLFSGELITVEMPLHRLIVGEYKRKKNTTNASEIIQYESENEH